MRTVVRVCLTVLLVSMGWGVQAEAAATILVTAAPYNAACNGTTNDATAIQNAINALPADGGTVQFPNTNLCGVGSAGLAITQRKSITLQGLGTNAGLKALAAGPVFPVYGATMLSLTACYDCRITGLTFDGNALSANLVGIQTSVGVRVDQNTFRNAGGNGAVVTAGNTGNVYERNTISSMLSSSRGFWIGNTSPTTAVERRPQVLDNTMTLTTASAIAGTHLDAEIRGNVLDGGGTNVGSAIPLGADSGIHCERTLIQGNRMTGFAQGVQSDSTNDGDWNSHVTVSGNTIQRMTSNGIYVYRARDWVVKDNSIEDSNVDAVGSGSGILIGMAKRIRAEGNRVTDTRTGASRTQSVGIRVQAGTSVRELEDITILKNVVSNNLVDGITVENSGAGTIERVLIQENLSTDNGDWGIGVKDAVDGDIKKVRAIGNSTARNVSGSIRMDPSDGCIDAACPP